jgi:hypothetical protein
MTRVAWTVLRTEGFLRKIQKMHFPWKCLYRKTNVTSESAPRELSNEWCKYVSSIINFGGNFCVPPLVKDGTISRLSRHVLPEITAERFKVSFLWSSKKLTFWCHNIEPSFLHNKPYVPDSPLVMSSDLIIILHMEKWFLMKSNLGGHISATAWNFWVK